MGLNLVLVIFIVLVVVCLILVIVYFVVSCIKKDCEINLFIFIYGIGVIFINGMLLIWKVDICFISFEWL